MLIVMIADAAEKFGLPKEIADRLLSNGQKGSYQPEQLLLLEMISGIKACPKTTECSQHTNGGMPTPEEFSYLSHISSDHVSSILKTFEGLQAIAGGELTTHTRRLRDDLLGYLVEISRQVRSFNRATAAQEHLPAMLEQYGSSHSGLRQRFEGVGAQVEKMNNLFTECMDVPLVALMAIYELVDDLPPELGGNMPGYRLDLPARGSDFRFIGQRTTEESLARQYLLPIRFAEREKCAAAGRKASLRAQMALKEAGKDEKLNDAIYQIDSCFIILCNDLRSKRRR